MTTTTQPLNTVHFGNDAEGRPFVFVHIDQSVTPNALSDLRKQIETGLSKEDLQDFIYENNGNSRTIVFGMRYNQHAKEDLCRKLGHLSEVIKAVLDIDVVIDMTAFPKD